MAAPASDGDRSMSPRRGGRRQRLASPFVPHRGRTRGRDMVVQKTVREVGGASYPMLTRDNYTDWSLVMKVMLQARGLWDTVEYGNADLQEDRAALEALLKAVPQEMIRALAIKRSAKEACDYIKSIRIGSDHVRKSKLQKLRTEFETVAFKEGEDPEDFALRLSCLVS